MAHIGVYIPNPKKHRHQTAQHLKVKRDYGAGWTYYSTMIHDIDKEQCLIVNSDFDAG